MEYHAIIPARFNSTRLPGKVLMEIAGKPMVQHVYERCIESGAETVVIATDDQRVADVAEKFGAEVCLTAEEHRTGTERIAEAVEAMEFDDDEIVVCVQADEPLIAPQNIRQVALDLDEHDNVKVTSVCEPIENVDELFDPNVVKVVLNRRHYAMYFTRAAVPWELGVFSKPETIELTGQHHRHIGIYGYRVGFLKDYINWAACPLERMESLEQLRILWNGGRIHMAIAQQKTLPGVDTQADLDRVREFFSKQGQ